MHPHLKHFCLSALTLLLVVQGAVATSDRPNILFILIDDFGWMDVGYNGSTFYETPELDALSKKWMRFDYCYTPSPMCSPTRVSILTGKNPARHGITQWLPGRTTAYLRKGETAAVFCPTPQTDRLLESEFTMGEAFKHAGYATAFYGKWHMGGKTSLGHGYDSERAIIGYNDCAMFYPFGRKLIDGKTQYFPEAKEGDNFTDLLTDAAIEYMTQEREKPFYLHLCYFAMHGPRASKPELQAHFEAKAKRMYASDSPWILDEYSHKKTKARQDDPVYAGELANLDANIGRLVKGLKEAGLYENTIIVFTGDNGGQENGYKFPTSNAPLRMGKTFVFEGGLRVPTLMHWPAQSRSGMSTETPVSSMDFYPTLLDMAGLLQIPEQHIDGMSLVPLFQEQVLERDTLYWHFPHYQGEGSYPASAIRVGDWKLIKNYHQGDFLLYDLKNDPYEATNMAQSMPEKVSQMERKLMAYLIEAGAYIPEAPKKHEWELMKIVKPPAK